MAKFGRSSQSRLDTCHPDIIKLFNVVVKKFDCSVIEGVRTLDRQMELFKAGKSTTLKSKHLPLHGLSYAIDVVPYPIAWGDSERRELLEAFDSRDKKMLVEKLTEYREALCRFYLFAGYVKGIANEMGINIRWGGDWDGDNSFSDQTFHDLPHFEIV